MNERDLFIAALQQDDPADRAAYLDQACGNDADLRARIGALLASCPPADSFLERPAVAVATGDFAPSGNGQETSSAWPLSEKPGMMIGPYKLLQQIGEGGMGTVFMAEQEHPVRRKVALKIIKPGMDSEQVIARFEAERQALALMDHPNIARVVDAGTTDSGRPYFVMELVHGVPITEYCDLNQFTPRERLDLFIPVCKAIQHAHQKGIIHRDIKPSNVLVTLYDGRPVPKVIDFGVAKATEQRLTERTLFTQYGSIVGTLEYMSPEQAEFSALGVDTRSDIYSLGVLLYELLTGTTPLQKAKLRDAGYSEILRMIREEEPPKPSTRLSTTDELPSIAAHRKTDPAKLSKLVRGDLDWIVMKALEKDRTRRYDTANGFARDVERYLEGDPVEACPPSAGYQIRKYACKHRAALLTAGAFVAVLVMGLLDSAYLAWRAMRAEAAAKQESFVARAAEAQATKEAAKAAAINRFLVDDLLSMAAPEMTRGRQVTIQEVLKQAAKKIDGAFEGQPEIKASVLHTIGDVYRRMGLYPEAELLLRRALELARHTLGPENEETLRVLISLAWAVDGAGKVAEAESLFSQALEPRRLAVLGPEHPDTLVAMAQLAWAYINVEKVPEGEELFRRTLDTSRRALSPGHPTTLFALNSLGYVLTLQGKTAEAEPLVLEANDTCRRELGPDHPETLNASSILGQLLLARGKAEEAEPKLRASLDEIRRVLGREYWFSLCSTFALTDSLIRQGKWSEAESLLREEVEIRRPLRGQRIDMTLTLISKLADVLCDQGKLAEAESLYREALQLTHDLPTPYVSASHVLRVIRQTKARGTGGPIGLEVVRSELLEGLGLCLLARSDAEQAERLIRESLDSRRSFLVETHAEIGESLTLLGAALMENGRPEQAESLLREGLGILRKALPAGHWRFAATDSFLGACLAAQGRPSEAEPLVLSGYRTLEADRHAPPLMVSLALERVIRLYDGWGKPEKAAEWRAKSQLPAEADLPRP